VPAIRWPNRRPVHPDETTRETPAIAMIENDPLYKLRHALAGLAISLLLSVPVAALLARLAGDLVGDSYGLRAGLYSILLAHVVVGAAVLFVRVARHETRPLGVGRLLLWLASLWLWPLLLLGRRTEAAPPPPSPPSPPA
jgi:hypothetical protein